MMNLEDLKIYNMAMEIGEEIWSIVEQWDGFNRGTIGRQLVSAGDSIAANIAEGYGRYHYGDAKNFNYFARGSLYETRTWLKKSSSRKLITIEKFNDLDVRLISLLKMLNSYIASIGGVHEPESPYNLSERSDESSN